MSETVMVKAKVIHYPGLCAACCQPSGKSYPIQANFIYGGESLTYATEIPLCEEHHRIASRKSPLEKLTQKAAGVLGLVLAVSSGLGLMRFWADEPAWARFGMAPVAGLCLGFTLAALIYFFVAPRMASPASKKIRQCVRIMACHPRQGTLELAMENAAFAAACRELNA